jgi:S-formylglutathione hydrolase FrmB
MKIPEIFMACGTEDPLLKENRKYHDFLVSQEISHEYKESSGRHNWKFWNEYLEKSIAWIFGLSSESGDNGKI